MFCNVSGECIDQSSRCDDYADCLDGTDEVGCGTPGENQIGSGGGDGRFLTILIQGPKVPEIRGPKAPWKITFFAETAFF